MYNYAEVAADKLEWVPVAAASELGDGQRLIVEVDGEAIAVFNIAGDYYAITDVCSHDDGPVAEGELVEYDIECPRHGAKFDVRTGAALSLPAIVDIPAYPVRERSGEIELGLPAEE